MSRGRRSVLARVTLLAAQVRTGADRGARSAPDTRGGDRARETRRNCVVALTGTPNAGMIA
jgi:hypothetical protein